MYENISYCGLNCLECEAYIATQANDSEALKKVAEKWAKEYGSTCLSVEKCICDGCKSRKRISTAHAHKCSVRLCAITKRVETCAHCKDYICSTLEQFLNYAPSLKDGLEKIRKELGRM